MLNCAIFEQFFSTLLVSFFDAPLISTKTALFLQWCNL